MATCRRELARVEAGSAGRKRINSGNEWSRRPLDRRLRLEGGNILCRQRLWLRCKWETCHYYTLEVVNVEDSCANQKDKHVSTRHTFRYLQRKSNI